MTISLCMIVKDEAQILENCLQSVCGIVDEINIIDTGSTDDTIKIAKKYTDRIFDFKWVHDFSAARNYAFSKATMDYVLWLDGDDIIEAGEAAKFLMLKKSLDAKVDCVYMYYDIKNPDGSCASVLKRERLVKRVKNFKWKRPIHEYLDVSGNCILENIHITQISKPQEKSIERNIEILKTLVEGKNTENIDLYYYGVALYQSGKMELALEQFLLFIKNRKNDSFTGVDAYTSAYNIYMSRGDFENAYRILAENEKPNHDKSEFYCCLGNFVSDVLKDYELAIKYYEKALLCNGKEADGVTFTYRIDEYYYFKPNYSIGLCYMYLKEFAKAKAYMIKAMEYKPNDKNVEAIINKLARLTELVEGY